MSRLEDASGPCDAGVTREVVGLAWPTAVGMLSFTCMGVVDTLLMGRVGTTAQAGVGLATTLAIAALAFSRGLAAGPQALVAAADGAGDPARVARAGGAGLLLGAVGSALAVLLFLGATWALGRVVHDEAVAASAARYLAVRAWEAPCTVMAFALLAGLQGLGDARARMWAGLLGNALNIGLDLVLIFGWGPIPPLGEEGAALATVLASTAMCALYALRFRRRFPRVRWPGAEVLRAGLTLGLPAGSQQVLCVLAFVVVGVVLANAGAVELAANEVVLNVMSVSFLPGLALGEAAGVVVGRALGAGRTARARAAVASARLLALGVMGACGLAFVLGGPRLGAWFSQDPEVVARIARLLLFAASFQLLDALAIVHLSALRGAGDARFCLLATSLPAWAVNLPLTLALAWGLGWGATGAWTALTAEIALIAAAASWRVRRLGRGLERLDLLLGAPAVKREEREEREEARGLVAVG